MIYKPKYLIQLFWGKAVVISLMVNTITHTAETMLNIISSLFMLYKSKFLNFDFAVIKIYYLKLEIFVQFILI